MSEAKKVETLSDALACCDILERLGEVYGDATEWGAIGTVRRVLRRQALLLVRLAMLWRQSPRDERLLGLLAAEAANEQHRMPDEGLPGEAVEFVEKPVPRPTPNPKD